PQAALPASQEPVLGDRGPVPVRETEATRRQRRLRVLLLRHTRRQLHPALRPPIERRPAANAPESTEGCGHLLVPGGLPNQQEAGRWWAHDPGAGRGWRVIREPTTRRRSRSRVRPGDPRPPPGRSTRRVR